MTIQLQSELGLRMRNTNFLTSGIFISICMLHIGILYLISINSLPQMNHAQMNSFEMVNIHTAPLTSAQTTNQDQQSAPSQQTPVIKSAPKPPAPQKALAAQTTPNKIQQPQHPVAEQTVATDPTNKVTESSKSTNETTTETASTNQTEQNSNHQNTNTAGSNQNTGSTHQEMTSQATTSEGSISAGQINNIARKYPEIAKEQGIAGSVRLRVRVGTNGRAQEVSILSSPHQLLSNAARLGARGATYKPAMTNGKAITTTLEFNVVYQLKKTPYPPTQTLND